jgi:hypothetical protein
LFGTAPTGFNRESALEALPNRAEMILHHDFESLYSRIKENYFQPHNHFFKRISFHRESELDELYQQALKIPTSYSFL